MEFPRGFPDSHHIARKVAHHQKINYIHKKAWLIETNPSISPISCIFSHEMVFIFLINISSVLNIPGLIYSLLISFLCALIMFNSWDNDDSVFTKSQKNRPGQQPYKRHDFVSFHSFTISQREPLQNFTRN